MSSLKKNSSGPSERGGGLNRAGRENGFGTRPKPSNSSPPKLLSPSLQSSISARTKTACCASAPNTPAAFHSAKSTLLHSRGHQGRREPQQVHPPPAPRSPKLQHRQRGPEPPARATEPDNQ